MKTLHRIDVKTQETVETTRELDIAFPICYEHDCTPDSVTDGSSIVHYTKITYSGNGILLMHDIAITKNATKGVTNIEIDIEYQHQLTNDEIRYAQYEYAFGKISEDEFNQVLILVKTYVNGI